LLGIVNYGSGNVHAVSNIYSRLNIEHVISGDPKVLESVSHLILPGVGAFDETMRILYDTGLKAFLDEMVLHRKTPVMGICVGMQLLAESSEEGNLPGFGWIKGAVKKFNPADLSVKPYLPHLGWNTVDLNYDHPLFKDIEQDKGFYFLHSYYYHCTNQCDIMGTTTYGKPFASAVHHENIYGMQFHPEKSHGNGINLFRNFINI
jgi:glutamine amidotransferase